MRLKNLNWFERSFLDALKSASIGIAMFTNISAVLAGIVYVLISQSGISLLPFILSFFLGYISWTFSEYVLHRFLFHDFEKSIVSKKIQFLIHGVHHASPENTVFIPLFVRLGFMFTVFFISQFFFSYVGVIFFSGYFLGFSFYSFLHYAMHNRKPPSFLAYLWHHHELHHYKFPDKAFGTSTRFWDRLFGTMPPISAKQSLNG